MELNQNVFLSSTKEALDFYLDYKAREGNFADLAKQIGISYDMKITKSGRNILAKMIDRITEELSKEQISQMKDNLAKLKCGAWVLFLDEVLKNEVFKAELDETAEDFLLHTPISTKEGYIPKFVEDGCLKAAPMRLMRNMAINTFLGACYQGSEEAIEKLKYLCKKNIPKVFNQVKKFGTMTFSDVVGLAEQEGQIACNDMAVILVVAELQCLIVKDECQVIYTYLNACIDENEVTNVYEFGIEEQSIAKEMATEFLQDSELYAKVIEYDDLCKQWLEISGFSKCYLPHCEMENVYYVAMLFTTVYVKRNITRDELAALIVMAKYLGIFRHVESESAEVIRLLAFGIDRKCGQNNSLLTVPPVNNRDMGRDDRNKETITKLEREVEELKRRLKDKENENSCLRMQISTIKKEREEATAFRTQFEDEHLELVALRNFVYSLPQEEIVPGPVNTIEIERLKSKKVLIIGGNQNWVNKMRSKFPDWEYVKPGVSGSVDPKIVRNVDMVYFYTSTLSHQVFGRFISILRTDKIRFGYLYGTNIDRVISRISQDL